MDRFILDTIDFDWDTDRLAFWACVGAKFVSSEEYEELAQHYEPNEYNGLVVIYPGRRNATKDSIVNIESIAVTAYDDTHGEGSSLDDICKFHYSTFAPYIKAGYKETWEKCDVTRESYFGEQPCAKLLSELEYPLELLQVERNPYGFCNVDERYKQECSPRCCFGRFEFTSRPTKPNAMVRITVTLADERAYSFNLNMGKGVK